MTGRRIPLNDEGRRINEGHHNCKISDDIVRLIRDLREIHNLEVPEIARKWPWISPHTVKSIVYYRRRDQVARDWKQVKDD